MRVLFFLRFLSAKKQEAALIAVSCYGMISEVGTNAHLTII